MELTRPFAPSLSMGPGLDNKLSALPCPWLLKPSGHSLSTERALVPQGADPWQTGEDETPAGRDNPD